MVVLAAAVPAGASAAVGDRAAGARAAVYVLSNQPTGNDVLRYERQRDGSLVQSASYPTGGTGTGAASDRRGRRHRRVRPPSVRGEPRHGHGLIIPLHHSRRRPSTAG